MIGSWRLRYRKGNNKKINIVKSNLEFNNIIHKGNKYVSNIFYTYVLINNYNYNRYGIAISTKIGNAVIRNKYKRQIKDIIDKIKINTYGYDINPEPTDEDKNAKNKNNNEGENENG